MLVATALLLGLSGCVRADAELVVDGRSDTVTGTITITAPLAEDSDAGREAAAATALAIENRVLPGIREVTGVTATAIAADGGYGTQLALNRVDIDDLYLGEAGPTSVPLIQRESNEYVVTGTIDAATQPDAPQPAAAGERRPGAAESSITIALTFPGPVTDVTAPDDVATIDGNTVTWSAPWDTTIVLDAQAAATSASFPPWIWKGLIWGAAGLGGLALLGLITVWIRSRND